MNTRNRIRIARIFGIDIGLDYSWFVIFIWISWSLADHYLMMYEDWSFALRLALGIATALLFFGSILAHEFGHSLVALATGVPVKGITLFIFGGVAQLSREPRRALDEMMIALAGPAVSLALAAGFGLAWFWGNLSRNDLLTALGSWLGGINLSLALFNLIPGFPLDGGRVLRAVVWRLTGDLHKATRVAVTSGRVVAGAFILLGLWLMIVSSWVNGLWLAFIGWFLNNAAATSATKLDLEELLEGLTAREVMDTKCPRVSPDLNLSRLVSDYVLPDNRRCFPVLRGDDLVGLVSVDQIKKVPHHVWATTPTGEIMTPAGRLARVGPDEALSQVLEHMTSQGASQLPVMDRDRLLGMLSKDYLLDFIRTCSDLAPD